ncbi:hypothetical protein [Pseudorhodoferax sp.]|uniref:hypothetical protein n=1 Tax=Pseudorhodoferax sp. TaxID=1993553 RepID=UPI0039E28C40
MEAALFTLDIVLLILLILAVSKADRSPPGKRSLGMLSYLESKTDQVQKGLRSQKEEQPGA